MQFASLTTFPQLGPISHKLTMRGGHSFVSIKPTSEHFHKGERGEESGSRSLAGDNSGLLGSTGSAVDHRVSSILTWITFPLLQLQEKLPAVPWLYGQRNKFQKKTPKIKIHYEINFSRENKIPERVFTHNQGWRQLFLFLCVLICSKWQFYSTICLVSSSCFIILYRNCLLLIESTMIVSEFLHLWKTDASCHSLVMEKENKKDSCSCQKNLSVISKGNSVAVSCN